jgi:hypothetical protein
MSRSASIAEEASRHGLEVGIFSKLLELLADLWHCVGQIKLDGDDRVVIDGLQHFADGNNLTLVVHHKDGQVDVSGFLFNTWMVG